MSLQKLLRAVPELKHFSPVEREDLLRSFAPASLVSSTLRDAAFRSMFISLVPGFIADHLLPGAGYVAGLILLGFIAVLTPIIYAYICRQIRDEFRILLHYLLTGKVLPACPRCAYDLTGAIQPRCPECGAVVKWQPQGGGVVSSPD